MYFGCHPRDLLPLIYIGASCNQIVYIAGKFDKGQYAAFVPELIVSYIYFYFYFVILNFSGSLKKIPSEDIVSYFKERIMNLLKEFEL